MLEHINLAACEFDKVKYDNDGNRIYGNVCLEVYLQSRGTCLLEHINLAACEFDTIPRAFVEGMQELCSLHSRTGVGDTGEYLPEEHDRQVGLGMLGLANLLGRYGITYKQFGDALERLLSLLQRLVATAHKALTALPLHLKLHHLLHVLLIVTVGRLVFKHMTTET